MDVDLAAVPASGVADARSRTGPDWPSLLVGVDAAVLALTAAGIVLHVLVRHVHAHGVQTFRAQEAVAAVAFGAGGLVLLRRRVALPLGLTASAVALTQGLAYAGAEYGIFVLGLHRGAAPGAPEAVWLSVWLGQVGYWLVPVLLLLLPDGRVQSARWRFAVACGVAAALISAAGWAVDPYSNLDAPVTFAHLTNPVAASPSVATGLLDVGLLLGAGTTVLALVGLVIRFRGSREVERQQLRWVLLSAGLTVALMVASLAAGPHWAGDLLLAAAFVPLPAGVAVAALRFRLWDLDLVINRAVLYGALTAATVATYVLAVLVLGGVLGSKIGAPLVSTVAVAVGAQPARQRLQRWADRRLYGSRGEPYTALSRLGQVLEGAAGRDPDLFIAVVSSISATLRLPYVALEVDGSVVAAVGDPPGAVERLAMVSGGDVVGDLTVGLRPGETGLSPRDRRLLGDLARQVAAVIENTRLSRDVQRSRERLVTAREEERRRIRRDLHDELGPQLAGTALQLDQARLRMPGEPAVAAELLEEQSARLRQLVVDVRRLVHDLRPPALDELGLDGAIRESARRMSSEAFDVTVFSSGDMQDLSAAVEAAAYRITSEAVANAARHSGGRRCRVRLVRTRDLEITVDDDGRGLPEAPRLGVGLRSMRERAEELGGSLVVEEPPGGGTRIRATLPLSL